MHNDLGTILHYPDEAHFLARLLCQVEPSLRHCKQEHLFGLGPGAFCKVEVVASIAPTLDFYGETLSHVDQHWGVGCPGSRCVNAGNETKATT